MLLTLEKVGYVVQKGLIFYITSYYNRLSLYISIWLLLKQNTIRRNYLMAHRYITLNHLWVSSSTFFWVYGLIKNCIQLQAVPQPTVMYT